MKKSNPADRENWYYLDSKHQIFGMYTDSDLMALYRKNVINDKTYVWKKGFDDWTRFKNIPEPIQSSGVVSTLSGIFRSKASQQIESKPVEFEYHFPYEKIHSSVINKEIIDNTKEIVDEGCVELCEVEEINYSAPYNVVWISEKHRENVSKLTGLLIQNLAAQKKLEAFRLSPTNPDGLIIGTGEADFTKGNVPYEFNYQNKTFQLIDVPGIEGDEGKYEHLVKQAIEKAHLVIYVNGTNKKPEEVTTRKIKSYINQYAKIYAICNVRGKADNYEFEEDQVSLAETHGDIDNVLNQTLTVLKQSVGADLIEGGQCMQGLLAFSSLAFDKNENKTTISLSRKDLIKSQSSYKRDFGSLDKMRLFSQVDMLEEKIISKFSTFEEDIVESNKRKIVRKIEDVIIVIKEQLDIHLELQTKIKKELDIGKESILRAINDLDANLSNKSSNAISCGFSNISDEGCEVIKNYFGENNIISSRVQSAVDNESYTLAQKLEEIRENEYSQFNNNIQDIIQRIGRNVEQVQVSFDLEHSQNLNFAVQLSNTSMFDAKSIGKGLMEIGGAAALGFSVGTVFPVVGNIIGTAAGLIVGIWSAITGWLTSKDSKINKAQSNFRNNVNSAKRDFSNQVRDSIREMISSTQQNIDRDVISGIYSEYEKMQDVERILSAQIQKLSNLNSQIKGKSYGTI